MPAKKEIPVDFGDYVKSYSLHEISTNDIAKKLGISKATVLKWMDLSGVKRHDRSVMIAKKMLGKPSHAKGSKRTPEQKAKISKAMKRRGPTTLGFKFSEESKKRMSDSAKNRDYTKLHAGLKVWLQKNKLTDDESIARRKSRDACKRLLRRVLVMSRKRKDKNTESMLGYTKDQLRNHLEKQFRDGMSWDERDSFHIDHIKPVAQFFREGIYYPSIINSLSNLQVLTPKENRAKSDKLETRAYV